jgi:hypothetical protein
MRYLIWIDSDHCLGMKCGEFNTYLNCETWGHGVELPTEDGEKQDQ